MPRNARKFTIFDELETSRRGPVALPLGSLTITLIAVPGPVYAQSVCDMPPVGSGTATAANSIGEMAASTGERSVVCRKNLGAVPDTAGFWRRALGAITAVLVVVMIVAGVIVLPEAAYAETCLLDSGSGSAPVSDSFACGNSASASAPNSTAVGNHTDAAGAYSVAVGFLSNASQSHAVAVGATSNASGTDSTAVGYGSEATAHRRLPPSAPSAAQPPSKPRLSVVRARRAGHSPRPSEPQAQQAA